MRSTADSGRSWLGGRGAITLPRRGASSSSHPPRLDLVQNSVALIGAKIAVMGLGFVFWIVAAREFQPATVGLAAAVVSAVMLCTQLALVGLGSSFISHLPKHSGNPSALLDPTITLVAIASTAVALLFLVFSGQFLRQLAPFVVDPVAAAVFVALCVVGTLGILLDQISTALMRGDQALVRNIVSGGVTLVHLVALAALTTAASPVAVVTAWITGGIGAVVLGYLQLRRSIAGYRYRPSVERGISRRLLAVGFPNHLLTLTERVPGFILPIAVTELLSPLQNAHWYAAWMMAWVVYVIPFQVGMTLFAQASDGRRDLVSSVRQGLKTSLILGLLGASGAAVAAPLMLSLLGPEYASTATSPMRILLLGVVPVAFIQAYFAVCRATHRLKEAIVIGALSALTGTVTAVTVGVAAGLTGMAVAWVVTQSATSVWAALRLRVLLQHTTTEGTSAGNGSTSPPVIQV